MLKKYYNNACKTTSDINEHLPTLYEYTKKCNSIIECGVRDVVSSYAFALGLKENNKNSYVLIDPYKSKNINKFLNLCKNEGVNAKFINESDLKCERENTDLLFIDTWHVYGHLKRELEYWNSYVNKYIIMHDTTVDEIKGETIRMKMNSKMQSIESGIPEEEINKGIWPAIDEFLQKYPEWTIEKRFTNNNGLTILSKKNN
jgi:hypothetical protein